MECHEAREHLSDLNRERLEANLAQTARAHVGQCAACREAFQTEVDLHALILAQAPRYGASPALRARIERVMVQASPAQGVRWRNWLRRHPWVVGGLAGAVAVLLVVWADVSWIRQDPVSRLMARAVTEHVEYAKEAMNRPAPDPLPLLEGLRSQVGFAFEPVFRGDSQVQLVSTVVTDLQGKRAATFIYRNTAGRYTTLFLMPEAGTAIPAEGRLPIETFKPHHRVASGRHLLLWKQRDLACLMVSDLDEAEMALMFLKVRKAA